MLRHLLFLCLLGLATIARAQDLDSLLERQRLADPREKIHIHFDRPHYGAGETIWFKAYLFSNGYPSEASRTLYTELLDDEGRVLSRHTAPIFFSGASGSFVIDSAYNRSLLFVKAYTQGQRNGDSSFVYLRPLPVMATRAARKTAAEGAPQLRFLPEGGSWVQQLPAVLAFIATDSRGLPVETSGVIRDAKGQQAATFRSAHNGMGSLRLTALPGQTYTAHWKDAKGRSYQTALPAAAASGLQLQVTDQPTGKRFTLTRSAQVPEAQQRLRVVATINQALAFSANIDLSARNSAGGLFPTEQLPSGILCITVFDSNNKPLAERITFVNNNDFEFDGDVYLPLKDHKRRGLNRVEITLSDTLPANLSLAVTDADLTEASNLDDNIVTRLLLTGELRGRIVNPYQYFYKTTDSTAARLDLVMLTHGWRRYVWEDVWAGRSPAQRHTEGNYIRLGGQMLGLPPGSYGNGLQLNGILQTADSARQIITMPVDRKGQVNTDGLIFYGESKLYYNLSGRQTVSATLQPRPGLDTGSWRVPMELIRSAWAEEPAGSVRAANERMSALAADARRKSITLETVIVAGKAKAPQTRTEDNYVSTLFSGDGLAFDFINDVQALGSMDIFQFLQGKVAGLQVTPGLSPILNWRGGAPAIFLNEMPVEPSRLAQTPVREIAFVKVIRPGESVVANSGNGVIAVYTRKGNDVRPDPTARGMSYVSINGYTPVKEFYAPNYATAADRDNPGDYRTTLLWKPNVYIDKGRRRVRFDFYNNDVTRNFRLVLEGINTEGKVIRVEKKLLAPAQ